MAARNQGPAVRWTASSTAAAGSSSPEEAADGGHGGFEFFAGRAAPAGAHRGAPGRARATLDRHRCHRRPGARPFRAAAIEAAAEALAAASAPVIVAGGGARGAATEIRALAERLGAPVMTTCNGKGVLPRITRSASAPSIRLPAAQQSIAGADVAPGGRQRTRRFRSVGRHRRQRRTRDPPGHRPGRNCDKNLAGQLTAARRRGRHPAGLLARRAATPAWPATGGCARRRSAGRLPGTGRDGGRGRGSRSTGPCGARCRPVPPSPGTRPRSPTSAPRISSTSSGPASSSTWPGSPPSATGCRPRSARRSPTRHGRWPCCSATAR